MHAHIHDGINLFQVDFKVSFGHFQDFTYYCCHTHFYDYGYCYYKCYLYNHLRGEAVGKYTNSICCCKIDMNYATISTIAGQVNKTINYRFYSFLCRKSNKTQIVN